MGHDMSCVDHSLGVFHALLTKCLLKSEKVCLWVTELIQLQVGIPRENQTVA